MTLDDYLQAARAGITRLTPAEALTAQERGALVVDIRPDEQRHRDGSIAGAIVIDRNVLEWRLAPTSPWRITEMTDPNRQLVLVCNQGYQSSLAASTLRQLGVPNAADIIGGFEAWIAAGLPRLDPGPVEGVNRPSRRKRT